MAPRRALLTLLAVLGLALGMCLGLAGCGSDVSASISSRARTIERLNGFEA